MSDAMHAVFANNDALAAEVQRLRAALAAANARIAELEADLRTQEECNYLAEYRQAVARAEAAEAKVVAASEVVYDLIGELADASGRTRAEIEAEFLSEVQP